MQRSDIRQSSLCTSLALGCRVELGVFSTANVAPVRPPTGRVDPNSFDLRGNAVLITVRGAPVESPPLIAEPFDQLNVRTDECLNSTALRPEEAHHRTSKTPP